MHDASSISASSAGTQTKGTALTLFICGVAALVEGFDTQAMGVAGPPLIREFHLTAGEAGLLFASGTLGQAVGATVGGRIADAVGRSRALLVSLLLIGVCSLLTIAQSTITGLFVMRIIAGLGLGAAMPNYITLAAESVRPGDRLRVVTLLMAAMPIGGTLASLTALANHLGWGWRTIFIAGGAVPLLLTLLMFGRTSDPQAAAPAPTTRSAPSSGLWATLFHGGRAPTTLFLWLAFFFTQLILLLMLNWLPTLIVQAGFTEQQASWTQVCFSISGALGSLVVGTLQSGQRRKLGVAATYSAIALALTSVAISRGHFSWVLVSSVVAGIFIIGAQLALYATSSLYYARAARASGVGGAVAIGRLGSVFGPLFAGALLSGGGTPASVLLGIQPFVLIGGIAALALCWRPEIRD